MASTVRLGIEARMTKSFAGPTDRAVNEHYDYEYATYYLSKSRGFDTF